MAYEGEITYTPNPMPDRHLMVDIETLGVTIDAAIVAIGAVVFDPRNTTYEDEYQITISQASNRREGRIVDEDTVIWWSQQSKEAQAAVFDGPHKSLNVAIDDFTRWINKLNPTCTRVWAKSPDFDCAILKHACQHMAVIWPFKFWEARCCRTAMEFAYPEGDFPHIEVDGPRHDALSDAKRQVLEIQHTYYILGC